MQNIFKNFKKLHKYIKSIKNKVEMLEQKSIIFEIKNSAWLKSIIKETEERSNEIG